MKKLFDGGATFALEYGFLARELRPFRQYIQGVELIPLRITEDDYEHNPPVPNAYGIYLRYTQEGIEKGNLNPSEWIADFSNEELAKRFLDLIQTLLSAQTEGQVSV